MIRQLYMSACGQANSAGAEALVHLTEGIRQVTAKLDVQETEETDVQVPIQLDEDFVEMPPELESITTITNVNTGEKLTAEPQGMRGRSAFMEPDTGKPARGEPQFWVVSNRRIYFRGRADDNYILQVLGRRKGVALTNDLMDTEPILPEQYHMAIVHAAAISFLTLHPDVASAIGSDVLPKLQQGLDIVLSDKPTPKERESNDRRDRFYIPFRFHSGF